MKKILILSLAIAVLCGQASIQAMEPLGQKEKWLILGAGDRGDTASWNAYTQARGVEWEGFNNGPMASLSKAIKGDFNKAEDLDRLTDGVYDKIFFDWSTIKFVHYWNKNILEVLRRKLKEKGELLIRFDAMMLSGGEYADEFRENPTYENYCLFWRRSIIADTLIFGSNIYIDPYAPGLRELVCDEFRRRYKKEQLHPYNIALLQSVFGNNVQLRVNRLHPDRTDSKYTTTYYRAVKSEEPTVNPGNEIDKAPYSDKVGDYTIQGRYFFPTQKDKQMTLCLVDADKNVYYVQYPEPAMTYRTLIAFINKVLGKEFTQLYLSGDMDPSRNGLVTLDTKPMMGYELLGLDGPYGADIPWAENPIEISDVPLIEHGITRDQLPENTPLPEPVYQAVEQRRTLWERIVALFRCCSREKVKII